MNRKKQYLDGMKTALPVVLGFIPVGIAYAIMAKQNGLTSGQTVLMSAMVFAGASQMMVVGMVTQGASMFTMILATFILNLRHLIMSTCVMNKNKNTRIKTKLLMAFGVTDESFAIYTTEEEGNCTSWFFLGLITVTYMGWNVGTIIGCIAEALLPRIVSDSLGISLYAMFIGLLLPNVKKHIKLAILVAIAAAISFLLNLVLSSSWSIILTTLISAAIGIVIMEDEE